MNPGSLIYPIRLERATETTNDYGEPVQAWVLLAETKAAIEPIGGNERFANLQVQSDASSRIKVRWFSAISDLSTKDRVVWGARIYDIKEVINSKERNRELHLMVKEHLDD